ncbi:MAG TPA: hypothetical protein VLH13_01035, partial [Methanomassiliicoccales archaeon]|nr:hypothetical protein [Methanomassiliicoccales archaeon]
MNDDVNWDIVKHTKGFGWRVASSIVSAFTYMAFLVAWLFFIANDYSIWENLGILLLSLIILVGFNALIWVPFGLRMADLEKEKSEWTWKGVVSGVIALAVGVTLIVWLLIYAAEYNVYQNLAVILIILLMGGGFNAA